MEWPDREGIHVSALRGFSRPGSVPGEILPPEHHLGCSMCSMCQVLGKSLEFSDPPDFLLKMGTEMPTSWVDVREIQARPDAQGGAQGRQPRSDLIVFL